MFASSSKTTNKICKLEKTSVVRKFKAYLQTIALLIHLHLSNYNKYTGEEMQLQSKENKGREININQFFAVGDCKKAPQINSRYSTLGNSIHHSSLHGNKTLKNNLPSWSCAICLNNNSLLLMHNYPRGIWFHVQTCFPG